MKVWHWFKLKWKISVYFISEKNVNIGKWNIVYSDQRQGKEMLRLRWKWGK